MGFTFESDKAIESNTNKSSLADSKPIYKHKKSTLIREGFILKKVKNDGIFHVQA